MLSLSMMLGMFSTSCEDMLSPDSERHAYTVAQDTLYSYWGILRSLQNIAERYVILNECRGDFVDASGFVSDTIAAIVDFGDVSNSETWKDGACAYLRVSDYYHIINSCNAYIAMCDTSRATGTNQPYMLKEYAQVQAIRAWVYMQLLYAYGPNRVPFYTEPMLTTDDINSFLADKNKKLLNSQVLAEEFAPVLERMEVVEKTYGLPQYNNYGDVNDPICHSSKCMFPVSIVLGDLYLLNNQYEDAALHYFNFIKSKNGGPLVVNNYFSRGNLDDRLDYPIYTYSGVPYYETGAVSRTRETITCIPSNVGKLDGKVLTDINRLFGFEAQMSTGTVTTLRLSDDGDIEESSDISSTIILNANYERELIPSKGYEALCDSQKFEIYVGSKPNRDNWDNFTFESLEELPGVGDARRSWIYAGSGRQWNFYVGDDILYGKMVSKQNPSSAFSTTYPVIYRKSTVWLRFAEALNRAGFPGYAFAILKTGLCDNKVWFPDDPKETYNNNKSNPLHISYYMSEDGYPYLYTFSSDYYYDYPITEYIFSYCTGKDDKGNEILVPEGWDSNNQITSLIDLISWYREYAKQLGGDGDGEDIEGDDGDDDISDMTDFEVFQKIYQDIRLLPASEDAFGNTPAVYYARACYFLDRREVERAANTPYLNIKEITGQDAYQRIYCKEQGKLFREESGSVRFLSAEDPDALYTIGVHQRGCGFIRWDDPEEFRSSYNYVTQVQKKIKESTGKELSEDDIYSGNYDAEVQDAVEDLIIDECGLELAFEGTRFSDLCRVAMRRGNPDYLAERVSKRHTGLVDEKLRGWLNNMNHWFLPLPEE